MNAEETNNYFLKKNLEIIESLERSITNHKNIIKEGNKILKNDIFLNDYDREGIESLVIKAKQFIIDDNKSIEEFKKIKLLFFSKN